ncbi:AAA family ATPase [Halostella salina]|uniref:AAA family ATPase n=1 Tax=Halostella salina TaxID=1547897 RepID=UPI000EF80F6D|nr:MoxR family ATPase [Halostella salina]
MSDAETSQRRSALETAGEPTDRRFRELTVLNDIGHDRVPEIEQETYHERAGESDRTDVEVVTRALDLGMNVVLKGQPGVGKSFLVRYVCAQTNRPLYRITLSETTFREDLLGSLHLVSGDDGETVTEWVDGPLTRAARVGGVLLLDELNAADANTAAALNAVMEQRGTRSLTLPQTGEQIQPHDQFRVVGTSNPGYQGTYELNDAFEDRFRHIKLDYLPESIEVDLVFDRTNLAREREPEIERLVSFAQRLREAHSDGELATPITSREIIRIARFMEDEFMTLTEAARSELVARVDEYDESLIRTLIDRQLSDVSD